MESKKPWQSKTIWVALVAAILPFVPVADAWVKANPEVYVSVLGGVFTVLRLITKGKISIE